MKKQILVLSGLLIGSQNISAMITKQVTRTKEEQFQANRQFVEATNAGDTDRIKALLKEGALRDTHTYRIFPFYAIRAPHEVAMSVLEQLEEYFNLQDIQATVQGNTHTDSSTGQTNRFLESFRDYLEHQRIDQKLTRAAKEGNAPLTKELMKKLALRCYGLTPFICAALQGHTEILDSILDAFENDPPLMERMAFRRLSEVNADRESIVRLFQRDVRNLDDQMGCLEKIRHYCESSSLEHAKFLIGIIAESIQVNLSRDIIFTFFSTHNNSLRLSLQAIGAQQLTYATHAVLPDKQEHLDRLLLFAVETDDELMKALIDEGADTSTVDSMKRTPLHIASCLENIRAVRILLRARAPIDAQDSGGVTPFCRCRITCPDVAQLLFESGASINAHYSRSFGVSRVDKQPFYKMLLQGSKLRYAPTKNDAKIAMQNVAFIIYIFGIKLNLPAYMVYEVLLFATGEQKDERGNVIAPEWTKSLKKSLAVLHLYKCNGNELFPLWEQTIRCLVKDPQQQALIISKLENFIRPFLGNDVLKLACTHFMQKIVEDAGQEQQSTYENDLFGEDFELYCNHLKESGYLAINGADAP